MFNFLFVMLCFSGNMHLPGTFLVPESFNIEWLTSPILIVVGMPYILHSTTEACVTYAYLIFDWNTQVTWQTLFIYICSLNMYSQIPMAQIVKGLKKTVSVIGKFKLTGLKYVVQTWAKGTKQSRHPWCSSHCNSSNWRSTVVEK